MIELKELEKFKHKASKLISFGIIKEWMLSNESLEGFCEEKINYYLQNSDIGFRSNVFDKCIELAWKIKDE